MNILLENIGRRFNKEWIFRNISESFSINDCIAVTGSNGSGKSTFLQLTSGFLLPSEGKIQYIKGTEIEAEKIYKYISFASPALELFEDLTLEETIRYHFQLKNLVPGISVNELADLWQLAGQEKKQLKNFSSGMRQRVKLGLAIHSDACILFLDEPTSNLDKNGIIWYRNLIQKHISDRIVFVASNKIEDDYFFCNKFLEIENYK